MSKITVTDGETFKLIRANLGDRYATGFPILKELIQNAEDSAATDLSFILCTGWMDADHPLLQHPGMLFANNGSLRHEHGRKMLSFANSSKSGEAGAIGRFGFGQKAVFHLCDAFIIHAFGHVDEFTDVANPCAELSFVSDHQAKTWEVLPSAADLARLIAALGVEYEKGLLLWIPFRNAAILPAPGLRFTAEEPTASGLADDIRIGRDQLLIILAGCRNLQRIRAISDAEIIIDLAVTPGSNQSASRARSGVGTVSEAKSGVSFRPRWRFRRSRRWRRGPVVRRRRVDHARNAGVSLGLGGCKVQDRSRYFG